MDLERLLSRLTGHSLASGAAASGRSVVVHTPEPGAGAGQYVAEFVSALAAEREKVKLFCPSNFSYDGEVAASGVEIIRAPLREVNYASLPRRVFRNLSFIFGALKRFWMTVRRGDVVHFQFALQLGLGLLFFLAARLKGASVVLTVHDPLPHHWILPRALRWVETALLSIGYGFCHRLIVHNQAGLRILVDRFHMDARDVAVIPHGPLNVPAPAMPPDRKRDGIEPLRLLVFGSLRENKGLHLAIGAIQQLRRLTLDRPVCLTIAGRTPNLMELAYWEGCKRKIQEHADGIEVIERLIEDVEVGPLFARHDAVLLPYLQFFSDSGVAMLALSQQRPILATGAGGLGELLEAADCGILIEVNTVEGVLAAVEKARLAPAGWLDGKGVNGYRYAFNGRSWSTIARQTQQLYDGLVV